MGAQLPVDRQIYFFYTKGRLSISKTGNIIHEYPNEFLPEKWFFI